MAEEEMPEEEEWSYYEDEAEDDEIEAVDQAALQEAFAAGCRAKDKTAQTRQNRGYRDSGKPQKGKSKGKRPESQMTASATAPALHAAKRGIGVVMQFAPTCNQVETLPTRRKVQPTTQQQHRVLARAALSNPEGAAPHRLSELMTDLHCSADTAQRAGKMAKLALLPSTLLHRRRGEMWWTSHRWKLMWRQVQRPRGRSLQSRHIHRRRSPRRRRIDHPVERSRRESRKLPQEKSRRREGSDLQVRTGVIAQGDLQVNIGLIETAHARGAA